MNESLATEMLKEIKQGARRWFIAFCIMVVLEILTIAGFMWYISLPASETTTTQEIENIDSSDITQIGVDNGESKADSKSN